MDHLTLDRLIFLTLLIVFFYSSVSLAATPVVLETGIHFGADGTMYYKPVGTAQSVLMYPDLQTTKDVSVNTSRGPQSLTVTRTPKIDLSRVGSAAVNFAKLLGPIGLGVSIAQIVCDLSKICSNSSGLWEKQADPAVAGYPAELPLYYWYSPSFTSNDGSRKYPAPDPLCAAFTAYKNSIGEYPPNVYVLSNVLATSASCAITNGIRTTSYPNGQTTTYTLSKAEGSSCPYHYQLTGGACVLVGNPTTGPATATDWEAAQSKLNDSRFIQPLLDKGEAVPVFVPTHIPLMEKEIGRTSEPVLDQAGNVTGTKETVTKLQATDASTPGSPNTFNITESTTINNYNTSNVLISTTTTTADPPPTTPPTETATTFDEVGDVPIQEKAVNPNYDSTSWGEGSCPAPVELVTSHGSFTIPTQQACDFAVTVKPIILLLATLSALMIIGGARAEA